MSTISTVVAAAAVTGGILLTANDSSHRGVAVTVASGQIAPPADLADPPDFAVVEQSGIALRSAADGDLVKLVSGPADIVDGPQRAGSLDLSPSGSTIYSDVVPLHNVDIDRLDVATGAAVRVASGADPELSPTGRYLAYAAGRGGARIGVLDLATGTTRQLYVNGLLGPGASFENTASLITWIGNDRFVAIPQRVSLTEAAVRRLDRTSKRSTTPTTPSSTPATTAPVSTTAPVPTAAPSTSTSGSTTTVAPQPTTTGTAPASSLPAPTGSSGSTTSSTAIPTSHTRGPTCTTAFTSHALGHCALVVDVGPQLRASPVFLGDASQPIDAVGGTGNGSTLLVGEGSGAGLVAIQWFAITANGARLASTVPMLGSPVIATFDPSGARVLYLKGSLHEQLWEADLGQHALSDQRRLLSDVPSYGIAW